MLHLFRTILESFVQSFQQLRTNKLRSFLTLMGITIGVFCIIGVQSAVDSLERNIRGSFEKLGDDVLYIQKMPWGEDPHTNYWKYRRRPAPDYDDYKALADKSSKAGLASYSSFMGAKTIKYKSSSVERVFAVAATYDYGALFGIEYDKGRYFNPSEYRHGANKVVIGYQVAEELFGAVEPIGKIIKLMGRKLEVIGVIKKAGNDLLQVMNFDEVVLVNYNFGRKVANVKSDNPFGGLVAVKAKPGVSLDDLRDDVTIVLRKERRIKPREDDNFALNSITMMADILNKVFGSMSIAGIIIGGFAIFVGMFSVANIMFVSVKERTPIIGIKKALGAKNYLILTEFLIEAVALCLIGGVLGLGIIFLVTKLLASIEGFNFIITLSAGNIILGIVISIVVGIIAGLIPAMKASKMDPIEAMR